MTSVSQKRLKQLKNIAANNYEGSSFNYYVRRNFFENLQFDELEFDRTNNRDSPTPRNFWNYPFYGIKDTKDEPMYPKEEYLKEVPSPSGNIKFLVNFAADAFRDLHNHFREARDRNFIDTEDDLSVSYIEARRAWKDGNETYHRFASALSEVFVEEEVSDTTKFNEISGFWDFVEEFKRYLIKMKQSPFPRILYFSDPSSVNPFVSGLAVEVLPKKYGDQTEAMEFYGSENYKFFAASARDHGFVLDKNAPWRMYADLGSPAMQEYMDEYEISGPQEVFHDQYNNLIDIEMENIRDLLVEFYNNYVIAVSETQKKKFQKCGSSQKFISKRPNLNFVTKQRYNSIDLTNLIPFLVDVLHAQGSYVRNDEERMLEKEEIKFEASKRAQSIDVNEAVRYIYHKVI